MMIYYQYINTLSDWCITEKYNDGVDEMNLDFVVNEIRNAKLELQKVSGLDSYVNMLNKIVKKVEEPLMVMVMGEFSTGKSSFINAFIGEEITTVGATETTAVITKLCYGNEDRVLVYFDDETMKEYSPFEFSELTAQQGSKGTDEVHKKIKFVERRMPIEILKDINIIDSPGLNTTIASHQDITENFIKQADTVLWMFNVEKALSRTEQKAIARLDSRLKPVAIINKMDQFDEDEEGCTEEEFIHNVGIKLQDKVTAVIGISAIFAIKGKKNNNSELVKASNIDKIKDIIDEKIIPNKNNYKLNSLADELGEFVDESMAYATEQDKANKQNEDVNYKKYIDNKRLTVSIVDVVGKCMQSMYDFFCDNKLNYSAVYLKALDYYYGIINEKNLEQAKELLEKAAINSHIKAQLSLVRLYLDLNMDDKAVYWIKTIYDQENYNATIVLDKLYKLGLMYFHGEERNKDIKKAIELLTEAANKNYILAQKFLADIYMNGTEVAKSVQNTIFWLEKIAKTGDVDAQVKVAGLYYDDNNSTKSIYWYKKASEQNNIEALYALGIIYSKTDPLQAKQYFERALTNKNYLAALELGKIYYYNKNVFSQNLENAKKYFEIAKKYKVADATKLLQKVCYDIIERDKDAKIIKATSAEEQYNLGEEFYEQDDIPRAIKAYTLAAENGLPEAQYKIADIFSKDIKFKDPGKAFYWYKKAAEQDYTDAIYELANCYSFSYGTTRNLKEALQLYQKSLKRNKYRAALEIAKIYYFGGDGIQQDIDKIEEYLHIAKDNNVFEADEWIEKLNVLIKNRNIKAKIEAAITPKDKYITGREFWRNGDYKEALDIIIQAADGGYIDAMLFLGHTYLNGSNVEKNMSEAFKRFLQAAELNNAEAQNMIGRCYEEGWGCEADDSKAIIWLKKAASSNDISAQYNLGMHYFWGNGLTKDYKKALSWYRIAAENGEYDAYARIAYCYLYGFGVSINVDKAKKLFSEASNLGSKLPEQWKEELAMAEQAANAKTAEEVYSIANNLWTKEYYQQAIHLYKRSAEAGFSEAQLRLGNFYLDIEKNNKEAFFWFGKAAINGNATAQNMLGRCFQEGWGTDIDYSRAVKWFETSARNGNSIAQYNLAICYENGSGCSANEYKAKEWLEKAAANGNENAKKRLGEYAAASSGCLLPILITFTAVCCVLFL